MKLPAAPLKQLAGHLFAAAVPHCRFGRSLFLLGHMRCGSTALSHVLTASPAISGYGEAHVTHGSRAALGVLAINQWRRGAWKPGARLLFDKVLHSRYDAPAGEPAPTSQLAGAHAIFLIRPPAESIASIRRLFARIGSGEYPTDEAAAAYYGERLATLRAHWHAWPAERRLGLTHAALTADPAAALGRISRLLALSPPLENRYAPPRAAMAHGAGDPLSSHRFTAIVAPQESSTLDGSPLTLNLPDGMLSELTRLYSQLSTEFME